MSDGCDQVKSTGLSSPIRGLSGPVVVDRCRAEFINRSAHRRQHSQRGLVIWDRRRGRSLPAKRAAQGEIGPKIAGVRLLDPLQERDRVTSGSPRLTCECQEERHRLLRDGGCL
jgi:hypothetical protein